MFRCISKQRHVSTGMYFFHYSLHYLGMRLSLGAGREFYIFQNTKSSALLNIQVKSKNLCDWELEI